MKKSTKILIIVAILLTVVAIVMMFVGRKTQNDLQGDIGTGNSTLNISSTEEMEKLISDIYLKAETFPSVATMTVDISDIDAVTNATGLTSTEKIDSIVISEPMISSQAYSLVLVKVKDANDANEIAKEMNEKVNPIKWICVSADKVYTTSSGNIVCLVMSSEEMAKPVYDEFKRLAGQVGQEFERENEEGIIEEDLLPAM